ncbi:hypothetical protein L207DRAFT_289727 [Hyaloscypha variabilis F]|uniref:Uncharacterized protein n=1 Tax=Hyaloscypha variabilis (strain UAMH 11265 / GT02V1 / F) TaxID=1149755 RepID=A0A2J6RX08_HYAVF|nr:hypothetical protein L207DRAFT_289727 [Hyaloscypha variabilis F]
MPLPPEVAEARRAAQEALSPPKTKPPAETDIKSSPQTAYSSTADRYRRITMSTMPTVYKDFRQRVRTFLPRQPDEKRYKSGDYTDTHGQIVERDPKTQYPWTRGVDDLDQRTDGNLSYGILQPYMMYFSGEPIRAGVSELSIAIASWDATSGLPVYGPDKTPMPINVKAGDDYLGLLWLDLSTNIAQILPADVHPDGFPYHDRPTCGMPFRPRVDHKDYPTEGLSFGYDERIAYIRCGAKGDGQIVILGGETFSIDDITDKMYRDFHHYFVDVTGRDRSKLRPLLDEPEEVRRRGPPPLSHIRPPGAVSAWEGAGHQLRERLNRYMDDPSTLTDGDLRMILRNCPTRGYNKEYPTYELLSHLAMSAHMYSAAFEAYNDNNASALDARHKMISDLDGAIDILATWAPDKGKIEGMHEELGNRLARVQRALVKHTSVEAAYQEELSTAMADIPEPWTILNALPHSILPGTHRNMCNLIAGTIARLNASTNGPYPSLAPPRANWKEPNSPDDPEYWKDGKQLEAYPSLWANVGNQRTDMLLQKLFVTTAQQLQSPKPGTVQPKSPKRSPPLSPESERQKRKSARLRTSSGSDTKKDIKDEPDVLPQGTISHDTHKWVYKSSLNTQAYAKKAISVFKVSPRPNAKAAMVAEIEKKVNRDRTGLTTEGQKWGDMVPK